MRKAYRRKGGRGRVALWGSLLALALAMTSFFVYAIILKVADGIAPGGWADLLTIPPIAFMIVLCGACFVWELRGPVEHSSLSLVGRTFVRIKDTDSERFSRARSPLIVGAVICVAMVIELGVVLLWDQSADTVLRLDTSAKGGMLFVAIVPVIISISLTWSATRPDSILIDRHGIVLPTDAKTRLMWSEIAEIRASASHNVPGDPLNDEIEIHLRDGRSRVKVATYRFQPWNRLGASPTDVLDALDRFRPDDVPIHDPRRIADDGSP